MLGIGLGVFMSTLDSSIVNISLPTLVEELDTDFATVQWIVLSYLLVITALTPSVARLGDMLGKKKLYVIGLAIFTFSSLLCGLAPNVGLLIAFRALQGTGSVMLTALGVAIITEVFPPSERGRALGIIGAVVSTGVASGPTLGGLLIGLVSWHAVFLVNVPIGIAAIFIVTRVVPPSIQTQSNQRFDVMGGLTMMVVLVCYALAMTLAQDMGFNNSLIIGLLVSAVAGLTIFVLIERRIQHPTVDLRLFRNTLLSINLLMTFLVFLMMAGQFILPFFLELVKGYPTEQVGLLIAVVPVSMGLVAPISGALSDRFGSRAISLIGLLVIAGACLLISTLNANISPLGYLARLAPLGIGFGLFQSPNNSAVMGAAPRDKLGVVSGLLSLARTLGQSTGLPLMGVVFTTQVVSRGNLLAGMDVTTAPPADLVYGVQNTFRIAALFILMATALAAFALWLDSRQHNPAIEKAPSAD
jgi:EmrB/QacA subfamily drug resistance transporter